MKRTTAELKAKEEGFLEGQKSLEQYLHNRPAPETLEFIKQQTKFNEEQSKFNQTMKLAMFGDESEMGLVKNVKKLTDVFDSFNGFSKVMILIVQILAGIAVSLGGIYAVIRFFQQLSKP